VVGVGRLGDNRAAARGAAVIVVGGEALVDLVPSANADGRCQDAPAGTARAARGGVARAGAGAAPGALVPRLGGGPFNVAVALGRLGAPAALLARLSTDAFGAAQLAALDAAGVDTSLVRRAPQPSALAVAAVGPDGSAGYTFYTAGTAAVGFTDPGPLPPAVTAVSLGSLGLVLEPGASAYEAVLHREAAAGRLVALDPNVRPQLIADPAAYRARLRSWLPSVGLLKLSVEDAEWLAGGTCVASEIRRWLTGEAATPPVVDGWLAAGPRAVVVTAGARGLVVRTARGRTVSVPAVPVAVADTIGAGDTVQAALLARLHAAGALGTGLADLDEPGWRDVLSYAARAAALTCSRPGADPPHATEM
jgi:fructokinase